MQQLNWQQTHFAITALVADDWLQGLVYNRETSNSGIYLGSYCIGSLSKVPLTIHRQPWKFTCTRHRYMYVRKWEALDSLSLDKDKASSEYLLFPVWIVIQFGLEVRRIRDLVVVAPLTEMVSDIEPPRNIKTTTVRSMCFPKVYSLHTNSDITQKRIHKKLVWVNWQGISVAIN